MSNYISRTFFFIWFINYHALFDCMVLEDPVFLVWGLEKDQTNLNSICDIDLADL